MYTMTQLRWTFAVMILLSPAISEAEDQPRWMPDIISEQWLNSDPLTGDKLRGKVILVEFWTFACWNCQHVEPYIKQWHKKYHASGMVTIAVHTPELFFEHKLERLRKYISKHEIHYPVAVDNDAKIWDSFHNWAWPTIYLVGKQGRIRYKRVGEGGYKETERMIQRLLNE